MLVEGLKAEKKKVSQRNQVVERLTQLRNLVRHVDSKFNNRKDRRRFWREFQTNEDFRIGLLNTLIKDIEKAEVLDNE